MRDDTLQQRPDVPFAFTLRRAAQFVEQLVEPLRQIVVPREEDLLEAGRVGPLLGREQLLEELLPRTDACVRYLDVIPRLEAGEAYQVFGEVGDFHRFAHVEDEDGAVVLHASCLQNELRGFGDGHEVARHVGVGDGDGAAPADLLFEGGDDASPAAEDIAEADGDEGAPLSCAGRRRADDHLGDALGGAHDGGGVDGLVGGDVDEDFDGVFKRQLSEVRRAEDVVEYCLLGVLLHQRDVLVRGGVEDDLRMEAFEDAGQPLAVAHVGDYGGEWKAEVLGAQLLLDLEEAVLSPSEQDEARRGEGDELTDDFRPDGAARAGDEDGSAPDVPGDLVEFEPDGLAVQQVLDLHVADAGDAHPAGEHLPDARDDAGGDVELRRPVDDGADDVPLRGGDGDQNFVDPEFPDGIGKPLHGAEDGRADEGESLLSGVVVEEGDGSHPGLGMAEHLAGDHGSGVPRADDQDALFLPRALSADGADVVLEDEAYSQAGAPPEQKGEQRIDEGDAAGNTVSTAEEQHREKKNTRRGCDCPPQPQEIADADAIPRLAVQSEEEVGAHLDENGKHDIQRHTLPVVSQHGKIQAQNKGAPRREACDGDVEQELHKKHSGKEGVVRHGVHPFGNGCSVYH